MSNSQLIYFIVQLYLRSVFKIKIVGVIELCHFFIHKIPYLENNEVPRTVITQCVCFQVRIKIVINVVYIIYM